MGDFAVMKERPEWGNVYDASLMRFVELFDEFDTLAISFSGGKDSALVLHLALDAMGRYGYDDTLHVVHIDDEFVLPETERFIESWVGDDRLKFWWCCLPVKYRNGCAVDEDNAWWYPWDENYEDSWIRELPEVPEEVSNERAELVRMDHPRASGFQKGETEHSEVTELLLPYEEFGKVTQVTGLRVAESMTRYQGIMKRRGWHGDPDRCEYDGPQHAHPIYDWDDEDLWHAFYVNDDWEYSGVYDAFARLGFTPSRMRTAHPYGEESLGHGMYEDVRRMWPEVFERAKHRVPGAKLMFELGTQIQEPVKKDDQTWQERTTELVASIQDTELRKRQQRRVNKMIRYHARHSTTPVSEEEPCPYCNVTWRSLARALQRGDLKGRHGLN